MSEVRLKVFITDCNDPYRNLAAEEMLLRYVESDEVLLYLWQNDNTVVIGRNQNAWRECSLDIIAASQGKLARRLSGGGAVFHDMGNQNFTFIAHKGLYDVSKQSDVICLAAQKFGIEAQRTGRNDITASGRKFSGNAFYSTGSVSYHHGTVLLSSDMSKLGEYLTPSKEKLQAKGVESVRSRVVNLCELNPEITPERMRRALIEAFEEIYGNTTEYIGETVLDKDEWESLREHYSSREWILGKQSSFDRKFHARLSFGEIELQFSVSDGIIEKAAIYSDAMNADWVDAVREALCGCGYDTDSIKVKLANMSIETAQSSELSDFLLSQISSS